MALRPTIAAARALVALVAVAVAWPAAARAADAAAPAAAFAGDYLPAPAAARVVTVTREGEAEAEVTVVTQALAEKETGPGETVAHFGEVYVFSPSTIAVRRGEPTRIDFWNLQADDEHDFMLVDAGLNVLMKVTLPPLTKTSYVFTFHRAGLFAFYCSYHQPAMAGQVLVLAPHAGASASGPAPR